MMARTRLLDRFLPAVAAMDGIDWDEVYRQELPRILNFFRYRVYDTATAEDLTSITFEKAWRGRDRYRRDLSAFSTWLFTIARNVAVDHYRRRRAEVPLDEGIEPSSDETPEDAAVRRSELLRLSGLMRDLPERE